MTGFGGPLSEDWIERRKDLNVLILARMRGLGMRPALSAFAGHVPEKFGTLHPTANVSRSPDWANFDRANPKTAAFADVYLLISFPPNRFHAPKINFMLPK